MRSELIDAEDAPPMPAGTVSKRAALIHQIVTSLAPGKVAKITLEGTETPRGTKTSLSRVAKKLGRNIATWDADNVVYARLADEPRRRGRPRRLRTG